MRPVREQRIGPGRLRLVTAVLMMIALLWALPITATARGEAVPMTVGEWKRIIYVAPERKVDPSQKGVAVTAPPVPPPVVQASSEPAPPKEPVVRAQIPRLWFAGGRQTVRRRRRRLR